MPYLLDGNNLIGLVRKTARPTDDDRQALIAELAGRLRASRARAILFFDGPAGGRDGSLGSLSIRTAAAGRSADDAIVETVTGARTPGECIVVTADRGLASRVREAGGKVSSPQDFFSRFGRGATAANEESKSAKVDVDDWLRWFEDEGNRGR